MSALKAAGGVLECGISAPMMLGFTREAIEVRQETGGVVECVVGWRHWSRCGDMDRVVDDGSGVIPWQLESLSLPSFVDMVALMPPVGADRPHWGRGDRFVLGDG